MSMAKMLIENLTDEFDPDRYHDEYREAIIRVAQAKAEGQEIHVAEAEPPKLMDLMAALKASVDASKRGGSPTPSRGQEASTSKSKPRVVKGKKAQSEATAEEKPRRRVAKAS